MNTKLFVLVFLVFVLLFGCTTLSEKLKNMAPDNTNPSVIGPGTNSTAVVNDDLPPLPPDDSGSTTSSNNEDVPPPPPPN
ncbi:MAG: hypothetical protein Q7S22_08930 [Candidatus Micrarchaeota archaeon]|nr:hypothetical protein [Candidatus Micrarchaeota archaeon]